MRPRVHCSKILLCCAWHVGLSPVLSVCGGGGGGTCVRGCEGVSC